MELKARGCIRRRASGSAMQGRAARGSRSFWRGCAAACIVIAGQVAAQVPSPTKIDDFVREPEFSRPALSPDGRLIAALVLGQGGRKQLAVIDPTELTKGRIAAVFADADIDGFQWISDRRLVFHATDLSSGGGSQLAPGLFAVDADGSGFRQLVDRNWRGIVTGGRKPGDRTLPWYTYLLGPSQDRNSDDVYVFQIPWDPTRHRPGDEAPDSILLRLNTRTGESENLSLGAPSGTGTWLVDEQGTARVRVVSRKGQVTVHYRDPKAGQWRVLTEFPSLGGDGFVPLRVRRDGTILVSSNSGRDTRALYVYDPAAGRIEPQAVVAVDGFDFDGIPVWESGSDRLLGVHVNADGAGTVWLDPRMKEIQKLIDTAMPGMVNRIAVPLRPATATMLVTSFSDAQPPMYSIYNAETRTLTRIARSRPGIDSKLMGRTDFVRIKARDGLEVPLYYTLPTAAAGKANLPTVVLLHGGPWIRGRRWDWNADAQLLASRGYLVLEPEFRGSTGYGFKHFQAGWRQWGLAMQDDVVDAVQWAVAKGLADPKRVCVAGASYGGYATLVALARDPGLFKCGVAWAGVTDIDLLFTANWTDMTESARRYGLRTLIGDPDKDADRLRAASPLANASRISQPLLLAYGGADLRVPIEHGRRFRDAVTKNNPDVEWVVYGDEGHGWTTLETRVDFWNRVEKFLALHLGQAAVKQ
jgi:dipeptidyl aminopeptidase/acylaminoacyl peptidase